MVTDADSPSASNLNLSASPKECHATHDRVQSRIEAIDAAREAVANRITFPHTLRCDNGISVALFQRVVEEVEGPLGETEQIDWVVTSLEDGEVTMKNRGGWDRKKTLTSAEFAESVEQGTLTPSWVVEGEQPRWSY